MISKIQDWEKKSPFNRLKHKHIPVLKVTRFLWLNINNAFIFNLLSELVSGFIPKQT